ARHILYCPGCSATFSFSSRTRPSLRSFPTRRSSDLDAAELYWQFIGDDWDIPADHVRVELTLPAGAGDVRAWGHGPLHGQVDIEDRKSTRLNSSHLKISHAVFCWKKRTNRGDHAAGV